MIDRRARRDARSAVVSRVRKELCVVLGFLVLCIGLLGGRTFSAAQDLTGQALSSPDSALEILAAGGIAWRGNESLYFAFGGVRAKRGETILESDRMFAHYRGENREIYRLDVEGNVRVISGNEELSGDTGFYDKDKAVYVMEGGSLRSHVGEEKSADGYLIAARDSLEYWFVDRLLVARGDVRYTADALRIHADTLVAGLGERSSASSDSGGSRSGGGIVRIEGEGNVRLHTPDIYIRADEALYDLDTEKVFLRGGVQIAQEGNHLSGDAAEVDLRANISTLRAEDATNRPIRGLLVPRKNPDESHTVQDATESNSEEEHSGARSP